MKLELKTENENENSSKSLRNVIFTVLFIMITIILCDLSLKLGNISRNYQINHICRLLIVEKSSSNFQKLSRLSNLKSKQNIWEFCKEIVN
tara:strand:- start:571 stop:843 length:273 start_codon:yes stop_codon:yes gene_type:complete